jgi:protein TonB
MLRRRAWSEFTFGKVIEGKLIPRLIPPAVPAEVIACKSSPGRSTLGPDTTTPPIYKPDPEYSDAARRDKLNGSVELGVDIGEDGSVRAVCVARSLRADLDGQAVGAVKTWRFEPARRDGVAIPWYAIVDVVFKTF